jgi:hypothetical protein
MGEEPNHATERQSGPLEIIQYFLEENRAKTTKLSVQYGPVGVSADTIWKERRMLE